MTVIVDYGLGNLFSLKSSLNYIGADCLVSGKADDIARGDRIILPGVGAFRDAAEKLAVTGLDEILKAQAKSKKPLMGICLGMQLLFDTGFEFGATPGLGLIPGEVKPIDSIIPIGYKIPHIGWNRLKFTEAGKCSPVFKYISDEDFVYFVHSFAAIDCRDSLIASAEYGCSLTAAVQRENIYGMQFHPEKSGETGLAILKAFCEL